MNIARPPLIYYLLIPVALVVFASNVIFLYCVTDDAYISYRYLDNWLGGKGLVFNPGERVEGYTNLLWILLIAPWRAMGLSPEIVSLALSILSAGALFVGVYILASRLTRHAGAGIAAVVLVASFPNFAHYVSAGLETILFAALIVLAFARISVTEKPDIWVAALLGAAVLTRPEGMMVGLIVYGIYGLKKSALSDRQMWGAVSVFLMFPIALTCWRLWYYGDPLPNTFYAKATGSGMELLGSGLAYLSRFVVGQYGWLFLIFALFVFLPPILKKLHNKNLICTLGLVLLVHFLYVIKVGGDYLPMTRFILHVFPLLVALAVLGLWFFCRARTGIILALASSIAIAQNVTFYNSADYRLVEKIRLLDAEWKDLASWLTSNYPPNTVIAVNAAGAIPYLTGFKTIDMLGLNDKHIARAKTSFRAATAGAGPVPGHFKYDGEYVCTLQPDVVIVSSGRSLVASSPQEAKIVAAMNSFDSDRDFLKACANLYQPSVSRLENGRYRVLFTKRQAISDMPELTAFARGLDLLGRARFSEARESFMEAIRDNPDNPDSYTNVGYTYFDEGRLKDAVSVFEETLRRFPAHPPALYGLALSTEKLGDTQRAVQLWYQYLDINADPKWKSRAAERLRMLGYEPTKEIR